MIILLHEIKKRDHSRWFIWNEMFNDYYMIMKDEKGLNRYHMFSQS